MKFRLLTAAERQEIKDTSRRQWHKWFAWYPVRLTTDCHEVRWLENVYRVGKSSYDGDGGTYWSWRYADNSFDVLRDVGNEDNE
jgi:hypothetical protein